MSLKQHFGLDIGTQELRAVWLEEVGTGIKLLTQGTAKTPEGAAVSEAISDHEELSLAIKKLVADTKIETKNVVFSLPESQVITRVVEVPALSEEELSSAIKWEAEQYLPVALTEVFFRYQVLTTATKNTPDAKMSVLLVAAPKDLINRYLSVLKMAGLETVGIETEILAISRALVPPSSPATLIVSLGAKTTDLSVVTSDGLAFVRSISSGSEAMTRSVASQLNLDPMSAEEYKKTYGLDPHELDGKVAASIAPVIDLIINEIKRAVVYYQSKAPQEIIKRVVLTGATARMNGLVEYLAQSLTLEVQVGDPFANILGNANADIVDGPAYAAAVGLALKKI